MSARNGITPFILVVTSTEGSYIFAFSKMNMVYQTSRYAGTLSKSETGLFVRIQIFRYGFGEGWGGAIGRSLPSR